MKRLGGKFKGTYFISSISITSAVAEFGISSIFTLFLLYVFHYSMDLTSTTFSCYYGFAYLLPILIGYICDKYFSREKSLKIGLISMIISQLLLAFSSSLYHPSSIVYENYIFNLQNISLFAGLFFLALGTSFSNLSITHMINLMNDSKSRVEGFSIYYPILNIGIIIGVVLMTVVIGEENYHLYQWAFLIIAIILTIGLAVFHLLKNKYLVDNKGNQMKDDFPRDSLKEEFYNFFKNISSKSISEIRKLNIKEKQKLFNKSITHEKDKLTVFFIFILMILFYRVTYSQSNISMVYFINNIVTRDFGWFEVPVQLFFILNPLFILILSPFFIKFNEFLEEKNMEPGFVNRTIIAMSLLVLCFLLLSIIGYMIDIDAIAKISVIWIFIFEFLLALSELFFLISGYSLIGHLAPEKYYSIFLGIFLATRSVSMFLSGMIATVFPEDMDPIFMNSIPVNGFMAYFLIFVVINIIAVMILIYKRKELTEKIYSEG